MNIPLTEEILYYTEAAKKEITISRFDHSLRVAEFAYELSLINRYEKPLDAYLAGILHDFTKQKTTNFHLEVFSKHNFEFRDLPINAYHAFSAYFVVQDRFDFTNKEILYSIRSHTLGREDMGLLEKILYVSDFLGSEYAGRSEDFSEWVENSKKNLYFGIYLKSSKTIQDLTEKQLPIHTNTISVYNLSVNKLVADHPIS
ncbi:MAG: HD domain-containing protein [Spirochaetia bacterium]|nr:HD domain-containing protein [Spirochaetia bacterium]